MTKVFRYFFHYAFEYESDLFVFQNFFNHDCDFQRFKIRLQCLEREIDLIDRNKKALYFLLSIFDVDQQAKKIVSIIAIFIESSKFSLESDVSCDCCFLIFHFLLRCLFKSFFFDRCRFRNRRCINFWVILFDDERLVIVINFEVNWAFETFRIECIRFVFYRKE